jgi:hypothetical protein
MMKSKTKSDPGWDGSAVLFSAEAIRFLRSVIALERDRGHDEQLLELMGKSGMKLVEQDRVFNILGMGEDQ